MAAPARADSLVDVTAVVLGGGRGTRLDPLTRYRSKPAVPLAGKYRLIDIAISNCINSGIRKIYVLTQFNSASLNRHVAQTYVFDAFSRGFVEILAAEQTIETERWYQGTADAVRRQLRHIVDRDATHFLVLSGDALYRQNFQEMIQEHISDNAEISISCKLVNDSDAPALGIVGIDEQRRVRWFREKPPTEDLPPLRMPEAVMEKAGLSSANKPFLGSMGTYLFRRDVMVRVLEENPAHDFGKQIIPGALDSHRVHAHLFDGYWEDIGTIKSFFRANLDLLNDKPEFDIYDPAFPFFSHARILPCSQIIDSQISRAMVAEGCLIRRAEIRNSVIGIRSVVLDGSRVENTVVMGADYLASCNPAEEVAGSGIGRNVIVRNAIIDKNARIGDGARIVNNEGVQNLDSDLYAIRDGIVIIPKNAVIAPGTVI
jgi:glucose-1-phosphate adenylyltransferase